MRDLLLISCGFLLGLGFDVVRAMFKRKTTGKIDMLRINFKGEEDN